jgi:hypothetical protein
MCVLKVCRGGCGNKPAIWIDGGLHGKEWLSPAVVTYLIKELVEGDSNHPELTQNLDWYFLPVHNPDGYVHTQSVQDQNDPKYSDARYWRGTRSTQNNRCKTGKHKWGVDGNRNWDFHWGEVGSSDNPCDSSQTYRGPEAFSEIETRNVRDFLLSHKINIKLFITYHSFSQMVLLPYNYAKCINKTTGECSQKPDNYMKILDLANIGNAALKKKHGREYEVGCSCILYVASGTSQDWAQGVANIPYTYTVELQPNSTVGPWEGFHPPKTVIEPTGEEQWEFVKAIANTIQSNSYRLPRDVKPTNYTLNLTLYLENSTTRGEVAILTKVTKATSRITLHAKATSVRIKEDKVTVEVLKTNGWDTVVVEKQGEDVEKDFHWLQLDQELPKDAQVRLTLPFTGVIKTANKSDDSSMQGIYSSAYDSRETVIGTKFEPTYAREAFPCFDEPNLKATFTLRIGRHKDFRSRSNMASSQVAIFTRPVCLNCCRKE